MSHSNESGRSIVELLCVLAVIAVLSIIAVKGYRVALRKHDVKVALEEATIAETKLMLARDQGTVRTWKNNQFVSLVAYKIDGSSHKIEEVSACETDPNNLPAGVKCGAAIKVDFKGDVEACKEFWTMHSNTTFKPAGDVLTGNAIDLDKLCDGQQ